MPGLLLCFVLRYDAYKRAQAAAAGAADPAQVPASLLLHQRITYFHCSLVGYFLGKILLREFQLLSTAETLIALAVRVQHVEMSTVGNEPALMSDVFMYRSVDSDSVIGVLQGGSAGTPLSRALHSSSPSHDGLPQGLSHRLSINTINNMYYNSVTVSCVSGVRSAVTMCRVI